MMLLDDKQREIALVKNIINTCLLLSKQLKLYGSKNKQIDLASARLSEFFASYFLSHDNLKFTVARHGFIYAEDFIERTNKSFVAFAYMLFQHGVGAITFQANISPHDIQTFLLLAGRAPSESWEEGGFAESLLMRGVEQVTVREMSENDLEYIHALAVPDRDELLREKSPMWDRFALAVSRGLTSKGQGGETDIDDANPYTLAELTNHALSGMSQASQQQFSKGVSNFLLSAQHEKISLYRQRALAKLTDFINRIAPEIRQRLFSNIFNLNMKPAFSEEFFSGLSNEVIVELLENSAQESGYVPPLILKLLGKIAQNKKLNMAHVEQLDEKLADKKKDVAKLFKKDDFEKYVPDEYRQALLNIIQHDSIPQESGANLLALKRSLEDSQQEKHTTEIIVKILNESPDEEYLRGLGENLGNIVFVYLEEGSYSDIVELWRLLKAQNFPAEDFQRFEEIMTSARFAEKTLAGINLYGKGKFEGIHALVVAVGASFVVPLLELLAIEVNRTNRLFCLQLLKELDSKTVLAAAVEYLDDARWFVVRNIIYLLSNLQEPEALPFIKPLSKHPHLKVRTEAIRSCLQYGCEDAVANLLKMLEGKDSKTVDTAISLALMVKKPAVTSRLILLLQENPIFNYRIEQKKAIAKALSEVAPKEALAVFFEVLASINIVHPKYHEQLKAEIFRVLERYDPRLLSRAIRQFGPSLGTETQNKLRRLSAKMEP